MKHYLLVFHQMPGCDYGIGCGIKITPLECENDGEALRESFKLVEETCGSFDGWKETLLGAELYTVSSSYNLEPALNEEEKTIRRKRSKRQEQEKEKKEREEYERLKKKFGK